MYLKLMQFLSTILIFILSTLSFADVDCFRDQERLKQRSDELQRIVHEDQADRDLPDGSKIDWSVVAPRDESRRKRVGEIFGEGCFATAQDFAAAALVFQHGNVPEHYFQTYLWSKRAVELGDVSQKKMMANGIDRYLVNIGHKQLFATQAFKVNSDKCHCLEQTELSFSDGRRSRDGAWTLKQGFEMVEKFDAGNGCGRPKFCERKLLPTPKGFVPGLW